MENKDKSVAKEKTRLERLLSITTWDEWSDFVKNEDMLGTANQEEWDAYEAKGEEMKQKSLAETAWIYEDKEFMDWWTKLQEKRKNDPPGSVYCPCCDERIENYWSLICDNCEWIRDADQEEDYLLEEGSNTMCLAEAIDRYEKYGTIYPDEEDIKKYEEKLERESGNK